MFKMKWIGLLFVATVVATIPVYAAPIQDIQMGFKTDLPTHWIAISPPTANVSRRLFLIPKIATVSVGIFLFEDTPTPGMVENIRVSNLYDGWITLFRRDLTDIELGRANADQGEIVAYGFNRIEPNNLMTKRVVVEYYFTKKNKGVVVSIETTEPDWKIAEASFKYFIRMFMLLQ